MTKERNGLENSWDDLSAHALALALALGEADRGSSAKSRGPHQLHRWGSDLVLDALGDGRSLRLGCGELLFSPRP